MMDALKGLVALVGCFLMYAILWYDFYIQQGDKGAGIMAGIIAVVFCILLVVYVVSCSVEFYQKSRRVKVENNR